MNVDVVQLAYYVGFGVLGWYLRHNSLTGSTPAAAKAPAAGASASIMATPAGSPVLSDYTIQDALAVFQAIQQHKLQLQDVQRLGQDLFGTQPAAPAASAAQAAAKPAA